MSVSDERAVAMAVGKYFGGDSPLGRGTRRAYCDDAEIPERTIANWSAGVSSAPAPRVRHMARWIAQRDAVQAVAFVAAVHGLDLSPAPAVKPCANVAVGALRVEAAAGALAQVVADALADGHVDHVEAVRIERATFPIARGAYELQAAARAVPTPQLSFA